MALTKAQLRLRAQRKADAVGSARWDTSAGVGGETDQVIGVAYDREWIRVLDAAPDLRVTKYTATTDTNGQVAGSNFSSSSARFHRVLGLYGPGGAVYRQGHWRDYVGADESPTYDRVWYKVGSAIQVQPIEASATVKLWVVHLPTAFTGLADSDVISVPSDAQDPTFTEVVALEAAALLLFKGGAEMTAGQGLQQQAEGLRRQMLNDLSRVAEGPVVFRHSDSPFDWSPTG
jgi:hypothetical protein